ncbi:MAG: hypothetical protein HQL17_07205 [Candidatus Omnitrophica bacterium]|nr:hypothetical protein [Candidatus Omnitrophota bacterium]
MFKKYWIVLILIAMLAASVTSILQTPWFSTVILRRMLAARPGVVVKTVVIKSQQFSLPGHFQFRNVRLVLQFEGKELTFETPELDVSGLQQWLGVDRRFLVGVEHAKVSYDTGAVDDLTAQFTVVPQGASGPVGAVQCRWDKWQAGDISAFLILNRTGLEVRALSFNAYDGHLTGKLMVRIDTPPLKYTGEIFTEGLNVAKLADVNPGITQQLDGTVTGTVSVGGDVHALQVLDASLVMPSGGNISASLLAALTQYLPASREKKRLDALINSGGKLGMELFSFTIKGGQQGRFAGELHLRSREVNLELNLTHEINTDGTIASLVGYWQKFVQ